MKCYVSGIAGFIGSNLANTLVANGHDVNGCDDLSFGYAENLTQDVKWSEKSITGVTKEELKGCDALIMCHTANIIFAQENILQTFRTNALDTLGLIEKFYDKIIYTSTCSVYGQAEIIPTIESAEIKLSNAYDQSKYIIERVLNQRKNHTTLRISNCFGVGQRPENPYCGIVSKFISQELSDIPITIYGDGTSTRDYTYVDDVVQAILKTVELPALNDVVNIASGVETSVIEVAQAIRNILGKQIQYNYLPNRSIDTISRRCLSVTKAKTLLNWSAQTPLMEGLRKTVEWVRSMA